MPKPISTQVSAEYVPGKGIHFPETARRGRAIEPSYSGGISHSVTHVETVTLSIPIGAIAANGSSTVSGSQGLDLSELDVAQSDTARLLFTNISATAPTNCIVGHPQVYLASTQGNPVGGLLSPGQSYDNLSMAANVPCYSIAGSSAGTITLTATLLVLGTSTG